MNSSQPDLTIVIPAFREAKKIENDIRAADAFLSKHGINGEILVVDDGSPDDTLETAGRLRGEFPRLRVYGYTPNRGKGRALRYGMERATGRIIMFADAGLCVPYDNALIGIHMIETGMCQIAHGSRRVRGTVIARSQPLFRQLGSKAFNTFIHIFMGIPHHITDTQCGFKIYKGEIAKELFSECFCDWFMYDIEMILRAERKKYLIVEFPVRWSNDADTRFHPLQGGAKRDLEELAIIRFTMLGMRKPPALVPVTPVDVDVIAQTAPAEVPASS